MLQNDTNTNIEQNCTDGVDDGRRRGEHNISWHYTPTIVILQRPNHAARGWRGGADSIKNLKLLLCGLTDQ